MGFHGEEFNRPIKFEGNGNCKGCDRMTGRSKKSLHRLDHTIIYARQHLPDAEILWIGKKPKDGCSRNIIPTSQVFIHPKKSAFSSQCQ